MTVQKMASTQVLTLVAREWKLVELAHRQCGLISWSCHNLIEILGVPIWKEIGGCDQNASYFLLF